ncbi:chondroitin proteoglycan-2-like [Actinia tenebrosa]|uniref:Chondroitin proteoglycan-2-like n=1 Tax=Actinia tenebrosa TaxID=6105 RepID=A0A6P8ILK5_ACTTE|nr:chondroitin proteoglycan-2-like [Actinia tenebrosa]
MKAVLLCVLIIALLVEDSLSKPILRIGVNRKPNRGHSGWLGGHKVKQNKRFCKRKPSGLYPDPENCYGFIQCSYGKAHYRDCPAGLKFDPTLSVCNWATMVDCENEGSGDLD